MCWVGFSVHLSVVACLFPRLRFDFGAATRCVRRFGPAACPAPPVAPRRGLATIGAVLGIVSTAAAIIKPLFG